MKRSDAVNEIAAALAKAQGKIKGAVKDSTNPHFKSQYADLASIWDACRAALTENGIGVVQDPSVDGDRVGITTLLLHSSGQWIESDPLWMTPRDISPQSAGSAITYARRYALSAMVGVAPTDDDDGNAAQQPEPRQAQRPAAKKPADPPIPAVEKAKAMTMDERFNTFLDRCRVVPKDKWDTAVTTTTGHPDFSADQKALLYATLAVRKFEYDLGAAAETGDTAYRSAILQEERPDVLAQMEGLIMNDARVIDRGKMLELIGKRELELTGAAA